MIFLSEMRRSGHKPRQKRETKMKKNEIEIGKVYIMKVSGKLTKVRLVSESPYGGWNGLNLETNREVRIRTAAKLRKEYIWCYWVDQHPLSPARWLPFTLR